VFRLPALENRFWFSGGAAQSRKIDMQAPRELRGALRDCHPATPESSASEGK